MAYCRYGSLRDFFFGKSKEYVFLRTDEKGETGIMDDGGSKFEDNVDLIDLIGNIILRETDDDDFAEKIAKILAERLGCADKLRSHILTFEEWEMITEYDNEHHRWIDPVFRVLAGARISPVRASITGHPGHRSARFPPLKYHITVESKDFDQAKKILSHFQNKRRIIKVEVPETI
jgi:hypothetical protein